MGQRHRQCPAGMGRLGPRLAVVEADGSVIYWRARLRPQAKGALLVFDLMDTIMDYTELVLGSDQPLDAQTVKSLGAFYTDAQIADFLSWWAIRSVGDLVIDPSFGGGVFLRSACRRLAMLGGQSANQVFGVEIDPSVYTCTVNDLSNEFGLRALNLWLGDFFDVEPADMPQMDVVIGNPPFIRYQRFTGDARQKALRRSAEQGVYLTELSSSWAPFLVHGIACLRPGGRLAMVVPMEMAHAAYARPILDYLSRSFRKTTFLTFRKKLFPTLSEDTLLLLAEDKDSGSGTFFLRDIAHAGRLTDIQKRERQSLSGTRRVNALTLAQGYERLVEYLIPKKARELYHALKNSPHTRPLGALADVGIGYVTGANGFFHLKSNEVKQWGIPKAFLKPAVRRGRVLTGLRFRRQDWQATLEAGEAGYLLYVQPGIALPLAVRQYLRRGEAQGVPQTYKCRTRTPWFYVPHVYRPDAFLSYMSGLTPRLVANEANVVAPNSLHVLRLYPATSLTSYALAALWQTSLTRLSVEIEGHALGGGMLKLEPTEAENVAVAWPRSEPPELAELSEELDTLVRSGDEATAHERAERAILMDGLGLNRSDCLLLRSAAETLRERRYTRGSKL